MLILIGIYINSTAAESETVLPVSEATSADSRAVGYCIIKTDKDFYKKYMEYELNE